MYSKTSLQCVWGFDLWICRYSFYLTYYIYLIIYVQYKTMKLLKNWKKLHSVPLWISCLVTFCLIQLPAPSMLNNLFGGIRYLFMYGVCVAGMSADYLMISNRTITCSCFGSALFICSGRKNSSSFCYRTTPYFCLRWGYNRYTGENLSSFWDLL